MATEAEKIPDWTDEFNDLSDDHKRRVRFCAQRFGVPLMSAFFRAKGLGLLNEETAGA